MHLELGGGRSDVEEAFEEEDLGHAHQPHQHRVHRRPLVNHGHQRVYPLQVLAALKGYVCVNTELENY